MALSIITYLTIEDMSSVARQMSIIDFAEGFIKVKPTGGIDIEESKKVFGQLTEMADLHELVLEFGRHRCVSLQPISAFFTKLTNPAVIGVKGIITVESGAWIPGQRPKGNV